jgi:hypothetical protein
MDLVDESEGDDHRKRPASLISIFRGTEDDDDNVNNSNECITELISVSQLSDSPADYSRRTVPESVSGRSESALSIYDAATDNNVVKFTNVKSKQRWKCAFCHNEFAWNATKVLKHVYDGVFSRHGWRSTIIQTAMLTT